MMVARSAPTPTTRWREDPLAFFADVLTLEDGRSYGRALDDWQRDDFANLNKRLHAWWERPRGHSKTADAGAFALHHLLTVPNARVYVAAADRDQAALTYDSLKEFVQRSPQLSATFTLGKWQVSATSTGATLTVLAADAPGSWGLRPSLVILDELSRWRGTDAEELLYALHSSLGKRQGARMIVATTAGNDQDSLCWSLRAAIQGDPAWTFSRRGQCASWIDPAFLEEQRRTLPDVIYRQVHDNVWTEGGVDPFVTPEQWDACEAFVPQLDETPDMSLVLGLDIGLRHDYTAVCLVSRDPQRHEDAVAVRECRVWQPPKGGEVDLTDVDTYVRKLCSQRNVECVVLDWWQGAGLAQGWRADGLWVEDFSQGERRAEADTQLLGLIVDKRLKHTGDAALREAMLNASSRVAQFEHRIRLTKRHPRKRIDLAVALSMAASQVLYLRL